MKTRDRVSMLLAAVLAVGAASFLLRGPQAADAQSMQRIALTPVPAGDDVAVLSGGCFWSMQAMFQQIKGVDSVIPGFSGGTTPNPSYDQVCTETTGYAETVRVVFNPSVISYPQLLTIFFTVHDPTTLDRQGDDVGTSYRSAIWYRTPEQKAAAEAAAREAAGEYPGQPIVTEIEPFTAFYPAERYHDDYYAHHPDTPYCALVVAPKVAKFQSHWRSWLKQG
jgi:peptide-methionine (S)-S-oxide reductase